MTYEICATAAAAKTIAKWGIESAVRKHLAGCLARLSSEPKPRPDDRDVKHLKGKVHCCHEYRAFGGNRKRVVYRVDAVAAKVHVFYAGDHPHDTASLREPANVTSTTKPLVTRGPDEPGSS